MLQVSEIFDILSKDFPGSVIFSSTFDQYVEALLDYLPSISNWPTVTQEIGDTWVHGAAPTSSDAESALCFNVAASLALVRACCRCWQRPSEACTLPRSHAAAQQSPGGSAADAGAEELLAHADEGDANKLCHARARFLKRIASDSTLCMNQVPEHTWGADIKTYLLDYVNWDNTNFQAHLHDRNYSDVVAGWCDQASYLDHAVEALGSSGEVRAQTQAASRWHTFAIVAVM